MHDEARAYVAQFATDKPVTVVELGSRRINGEVRDLFPNARYTGVDILDGPGVDEVADGATYKPKRKPDVVVCCETLEHAIEWRDMARNACRMLKPGGRVIFTAAAPNRRPHSGIDGGLLRGDEFYENIHPDELTLAVEGLLSEFEVTWDRDDIQATGVR